MSLVYFESFNTMARIGGSLDAGGDQDTAPYWANATFNRHSFVDGPVGQGQAIRVREHMRYLFTSNGLSSRHIIVGAWIKLVANSGGNENTSAISIGWGETYDPASIIYTNVDASGNVRLRYNNTLVGATHSAALSTTTWTHMILDVDQVNNVVKLWFNGALVETLSIAITPWVLNECAINIGLIPQGLNITRHDILVDSLYIATDEPLNNDESDILGLYVAGTHDRYQTTSLTGFLGTLIVDGDRYESTSYYANIETETYDPGKNFASKLHYNFFTNPKTGEVWHDLTEIDYWGLCCDPDGSNHTARLCNMTLEYLDWNNGKPIARVASPAPASYFSGPWVKQDASLSYYAHVNKVPREAEEDWADTTSLFINDYGCMLFVPYFPPDPDEPVPTLEGIGITFAEERRTDYHDWVDVVGRDGEDYQSYFVSGYSLAGQADKFFTNNYLTINYRNVDDGAAYAQGVWDFANSDQSSRWSMRQKVYGPARVVSGFYTHGSRKLMIRGNGRALQVRISSQEGAPFNINGWVMYITGNSKT